MRDALGATLAGVRLTAWRAADDLVHVAPTAERPPRRADLEAMLESLAANGARVVRTSALSPAESVPFDELGFHERGRLLLLSCALRRGPRPRDPRVRRGRAADHGELLELDGHCFPDLWRFDRSLLLDALGATPITRFRVAEDSGPIGYAINGIAGANAYLQRLVVAADRQRRGIGRALVDDAREWSVRRGATTMVVNTAADNSQALAFYASLGFTRRGAELIVMERRLDA